MKRGFLLSQPGRPFSAHPRQTRSEEELQRERDALIMSRLSIDQAIEYESLREEITTDKEAVRPHPLFFMF